MNPPATGGWLFGRRTDLAVFGGSALVSFALVGLGWAGGFLRGDTPLWAWVVAVVLVDVAHVWSTAWRVYFDPVELRRRPWLYLGGPALVYVLCVVLHLQSPGLFWRVLAYAAVFHFVRQQYGWVALYRRRAGDHSRVDRWIDTAAIYAATVYPILHWHTDLSKSFHWFIAGDFVPGLPAWIDPPLRALHFAILGVYLLRQLQRVARGEGVCWGKQVVVLSSWACWYGGIVWLDSDYAFTVTNVFIHGVPYMALLWRYGRGRHGSGEGALAQVFSGSWLVFYLVLAALAFSEELLWDALVWGDHPQLFGVWGEVLTGTAASLVVPLLAVPQAAHYLLDGFIWRVGPRNPDLGEVLGLASAPVSAPETPAEAGASPAA